MNGSWQHSFKLLYTLQRAHFPHPHTPITTTTTITNAVRLTDSEWDGRSCLLPLGGVAILAVSYLQTAVNRRLIASQKKDVWSLQLYQASLAPQDLPCAGAGRGHAHLRARGERLYVCACVCSVPANINNTHCIAL